MNSGVSKSKILTSLFWKLMERGGTQGIQFIVQIMLARLLMPEDYGIIALIMIFISIADVFVQSGFSTALIQRKDTNDTDFSSVFYLNLFVCSLLYSVFVLTAPVIAAFYEKPQMIPIIRVLSIILLFGAFNSIQNAIIARSMQFKKLFFSSLGAITVSGTVGIIFAYAGFGVWALVGQQITNQLLITSILWFTVKWRPGKLFSFERVKILFSYGWKLLVSSLIDTIYMNIRNLMIGKMYNAEILGFYNRGDQFPALIVTNINGSIQNVMFPALSSEQDNKQRVKDMVRRSIVTSSYILFPVLVGLTVVAKPLIEILLTDKWLPSVPFLQIFCASYALWPIHTANLQAVNALGHSDIYLKLEIIKKTIGLVVLIVTLFYGVYAIAFGSVLTGVISTFINSYPNQKLLNYSPKEQCKDILPSLVLSLVMGAVIHTFNFLNLETWQILILQIAVGAVLYICLSKIFKIESFIYLIATMKELLRAGKRQRVKD